MSLECLNMQPWIGHSAVLMWLALFIDTFACHMHIDLSSALRYTDISGCLVLCPHAYHGCAPHVMNAIGAYPGTDVILAQGIMNIFNYPRHIYGHGVDEFQAS